jgi:hypothetical protein
MKNSSLFNFLTTKTIDDSSHESHESETLQHQTANSIDSYLEVLMERANLDSTVAGRENSIEYNTLTQIVSVSRKDADQSYVDVSDDEDAEHQLDPQPSSSELVAEPFSEMESENAHVALFKFLFEPIDPSFQNDESSDLILSTELISDLQNLKDRMQHRYNVLKRNLFNIQSHE